MDAFYVFSCFSYYHNWRFNKVNGLWSFYEWELFKGFIPPLNQEQMEMYFELYKQIPEFKLKIYNEFK